MLRHVSSVQKAFGPDLKTDRQKQATAVQFMRRFYLSNSPMTYHPKEILPSVIFLATKTENHYIPLQKFVSQYPKATAETVIAPEFLLTQGLRFTFDVRHPQRALEGGYMELVAWANGRGSGLNSGSISPSVQTGMLGLKPVKHGAAKAKLVADVVNRTQAAYNKAKDILKTSALLTDAYFLFTPSQIWLAALLLADEPLGKFYIDNKVPLSTGIRPRLINTLKSCCETLESSPSAEPDKEEMEQLTKIDKKLYKCRNPEKIDLVSINKAQKRDSEGRGENHLDDKIVKKRKLEREKSEKEARDVFGPAIPIKSGG